MQTRFLGRTLCALIFVAVATPRRRAIAEIGDLAADRVLGQSSLTDRVALPIGPASFAKPSGVAIDRSTVPNRVYVADSVYHRVLGWRDADTLVSGAPADLILGQPDFASFGCNRQPVDSGIPAAPTLSSLCEPRGLAVDGDGNLYVADTRNCRVLVFFDPFATDDVADLILGQTSGACDGSASATRLYDPHGVTVDDAGNVFVADTLHCRVLEYDTPIGGDSVADRVYGQTNFTDHTCNSNNLYFPESLSLDGSGNLYVGTSAWIYEFDGALADTTIDRRLGTVSCNEGGESASTTCGPIAVTTDSAGHLFVGDAGNSRVLEFDSPFTVNQAAHVFGQPGFSGSTDLFHDACNSGGPSATSLCLRKVQLLTLGGTYEELAAVAVDGQGRLYVADGLNHRVLRYDAPLDSDTAADLVLGHAAMDDIRKPVVPVTEPQVAVNSGNFTLAILEARTSRILLFPSFGSYPDTPISVIGQPDLTTAGCNAGGVSAASLCNPTAAAVDPAGNLWVADTGNNRVLEFNYPWFQYDYAAKQYVTRKDADRVFGQPDFRSNTCAAGAPGLCGPQGVAVDARFNLYISDTDNHRIVHHENPLADATAERVYGQPDFAGGKCNGGGLGADSLCDPRGLVVDRSGNLFIADRGNHRVVVYDRVYENGGGGDHVFGQQGSFSTARCSGGAAGLCHPTAVALDSGEDLFVADTDNNRVLEYDNPLSDTNADRFFGQSGPDGVECNFGGVSDRSLCQPVGVAISTPYYDQVFVADAGNNRVLRFDAPFCVSDFQLTPATRALRGFRSTPLKTAVKITYGQNPSAADDILTFKGRLVLLESDGGLGGGDEPLITLATPEGIIFQERVPYLRNVRVTSNGGVWDTDFLKGERDSGIDDFEVKENFLIPADDTKPQRDQVGFRGRAVGLNLFPFTATSADFRLQYGSLCFTTQLSCRSTRSGSKCQPTR